MEQKKCSDCKEFKSFNEFSNDKTRSDGKCYKCRVCNRERGKKYFNENKDKVKIKHKEYNEKNKEKISEQKKAYNEKNKEKISKQKKTYRENNKEKISEREKEYRERNKERLINYRENNKEKIAKRGKEYYQDKREEKIKKGKEYRINNREKITVKQWIKNGIKSDNYHNLYEEYFNASHCYLCEKEFDNSPKLRKCLDHDHLSGYPRFVCCCSCNGKLQAVDNNRMKLIIQMRIYIDRKYHY